MTNVSCVVYGQDIYQPQLVKLTNLFLSGKPGQTFKIFFILKTNDDRSFILHFRTSRDLCMEKSISMVSVRSKGKGWWKPRAILCTRGSRTLVIQIYHNVDVKYSLWSLVNIHLSYS